MRVGFLAAVAVGVIGGATLVFAPHVVDAFGNWGPPARHDAAADGSAATQGKKETAGIQPEVRDAVTRDAHELPWHPLVDRRSVGQPWGEVKGLTMFRGNPTRSYYGAGPVPRDPAVVWRYPDAAMCSVEHLPSGETDKWCGTGWTGQPLVWRPPGGVTEVIVGAYDYNVHFVDGTTGAPTRLPFATGDMVKGTETLDPDGYPLLYAGSRDGKLRIVALDRGAPTELWALSANPRRVWNNDWDGNVAIVDGVMYVGGEDSWFYAVRLNRSVDDDGRVQVDPEVVLGLPGFNDELFSAIGDFNVSIESSVALFEGRAYFANSGGRIVGLDVDEVAAGGDAPLVFDFWTGDDTDATITIDAEGMLYVAVELERFLPRAGEVGQLIKLDPYTDGDPVVWSIDAPPPTKDDVGGIWATPALHDDVLYVTTHAGDLLGVDTDDGKVFYRERVGYHEWGSPVVVDDTLVVPLCAQAGLRAYDLTEPRAPDELWTVGLGGCVESTPAVWNGRIYVGSRDGFLYAVGDG